MYPKSSFKIEYYRCIKNFLMSLSNLICPTVNCNLKSLFVVLIYSFDLSLHILKLYMVLAFMVLEFI